MDISIKYFILDIRNCSVKAIQKNKEIEAFGRQNLSVFLEDNKPEEKFYLFETDKILEKERIEMEVMREKAL